MHSLLNRSQSLQTGLDSSHFFFRNLHVRQPFLDFSLDLSNFCKFVAPSPEAISEVKSSGSFKRLTLEDSSHSIGGSSTLTEDGSGEVLLSPFLESKMENIACHMRCGGKDRLGFDELVQDLFFGTFEVRSPIEGELEKQKQGERRIKKTNLKSTKRDAVKQWNRLAMFSA